MSDQQTDNRIITGARERIAFLERHCHDLVAQREKAIDEAIEARQERDKAVEALRALRSEAKLDEEEGPMSSDWATTGKLREKRDGEAAS